MMSASTKDDSGNFQVVVRVRPPLPREKEGGKFVNNVRSRSNEGQVFSQWHTAVSLRVLFPERRRRSPE